MAYGLSLLEGFAWAVGLELIYPGGASAPRLPPVPALGRREVLYERRYRTSMTVPEWETSWLFCDAPYLVHPAREAPGSVARSPLSAPISLFSAPSQLQPRRTPGKGSAGCPGVVLKPAGRSCRPSSWPWAGSGETSVTAAGWIALPRTTGMAFAG
jgi:hypothetical protein